MIESDDKNLKRAAGETEEDEGGGESGAQGGSGGAIEFRDFISIRSPQLSAEEERLLLISHNDTHGGLVEKQKKTLDQREDRNAGRTAGQQFGAGGGGGNSLYLKHPVLGETAEFDGVDPQLNSDPTLNDANTNEEKKKELTYQQQLRLGLQNQPSFNPKLSPF